MSTELKDTLNLPKTDFPMRANLAQREPERLRHWEAEEVYAKTLEERKKGEWFILPDGPPYANGDIHMGHALNKLLKDFIIRYKTMRGYYAPYVPGFDCHGLPIEQQILKKVGSKIHEMDAASLRKACAEYAQKYIALQTEQFKRLGVQGDWESPYLTLDPHYEAGILECLLELVKQDLIVKGHRVVHWDPVFRTALAEAEIEYHPHKSPSIYVKFPLDNAAQYAELEGVKDQEVSVVIWTTTPWTLPANLGVTLHPEFEYVALSNGEQAYIVAKGLLETFTSACGLEGYAVVASFTAGFLEKGTCEHPIFPGKKSLLMLGDHVTLEQGTGCVHTAPGHGQDDFAIGQRYGLEVFVPVDAKGCFTEAFPEMAGEFVFKANPAIVEKLEREGTLLSEGTVEHEYPFSWRSKKPIIFRATEQWFFNLQDGVRERALKAIDEEVEWIPHWGHDRIRGMVERRPEWCISRQRSWGVPIPSLRSKRTGESILDERVLEKTIEVVREKGTDAWFTEPVEAFLPEGFVYEGTGEVKPEEFEKENDILDVWFDSGSSHMASLEADERLRSPADLYLEGSDQHRGWFQAALLTSVGARDRAPFKAVLTHGFILDGQGRAMSKSMGNVISPLKLVEKYGADNIRLWAASLNYTNDVSVSEEIMGNVTRAYRDIRNTLRYQLGTLYDFDYERDAVSVSDLLPLDGWALDRLYLLVTGVTEAYDKYEFHNAYRLLVDFCGTTLSALYHDILKDRMYTFAPDSRGRRSAQTVLYHIFDCLSRLLAPILSFTTDEARAHWKHNSDFGESAVQSEIWPEAKAEWANETIRKDFELLLKIREQLNEKLEALRQEKVIGKSIDAQAWIEAPAGSRELEVLKKHETELAELFVVSAVSLQSTDAGENLKLKADHADGVRCPRSLRWVPELVNTPYGEVSLRCAEALKAIKPDEAGALTSKD